MSRAEDRMWQSLPTIESLNDNSRNTMKVDYVRTFELEEIVLPDKGYNSVGN